MMHTHTCLMVLNSRRRRCECGLWAVALQPCVLFSAGTKIAAFLCFEWVLVPAGIEKVICGADCVASSTGLRPSSRQLLIPFVDASSAVLITFRLAR